MDYIELKCEITGNTEVAREVLTAELGGLGYESFQDFDGGLLAYINQSMFEEGAYLDIYCVKEKIFGEINFSHQLFKDRNWNEYWEKNFQPVIIRDKLIIKAPFHNIAEKFTYELVLEPKMSFGTGHHATTWLMLDEMLNMDLEGKEVLDIGCGTGILAIFAAMKNAKNVVAFDNNNWAFNNALENAALNNTHEVDIKLGEISSVGLSSPFDVILANINRNAILEEMPKYLQFLKEGGDILFSGILIENFKEIDGLAQSLGLKLRKTTEREKWLLSRYQK